MISIEEIKKQISVRQRILDILLKIFGLQTRLEKLQWEHKVRAIAANYNVDVEMLVATIYCESDMNPKAINKNANGTTDFGICQFNDYWYSDLISPDVALNQPEVAINLMCKMWETGRAHDWICYRTKKYIQFLNIKKNV